MRDQAEDVLSAWTALEVLSPATYRKPEDLAQGDHRLIAKLAAGHPLPWAGEGEKSRPKKRLFYHVVLGGIRMPEATTDLLSVFVDKNQDRRPTRGFAAIGTVTVDKTGCLVAEDACTVSSFAWGLPLALGQDLVALGRWPEAEPKLLERLDAKLRRKDRDGKPVPLDWTTIAAACDWLVGELGLGRSLVEPPSFAIRAYHYMFAQEPPESPLLGSFFLKDLASTAGLVRAGKAPANLQSVIWGSRRPPNATTCSGTCGTCRTRSRRPACRRDGGRRRAAIRSSPCSRWRSTSRRVPRRAPLSSPPTALRGRARRPCSATSSPTSS